MNDNNQMFTGAGEALLQRIQSTTLLNKIVITVNRMSSRYSTPMGSRTEICAMSCLKVVPFTSSYLLLEPIRNIIDLRWADAQVVSNPISSPDRRLVCGDRGRKSMYQSKLIASSSL